MFKTLFTSDVMRQNLICSHFYPFFITFKHCFIALFGSHCCMLTNKTVDIHIFRTHSFMCVLRGKTNQQITKIFIGNLSEKIIHPLQIAFGRRRRIDMRERKKNSIFQRNCPNKKQKKAFCFIASVTIFPSPIAFLLLDKRNEKKINISFDIETKQMS